jgi:hypothetical protein
MRLKAATFRAYVAMLEHDSKRDAVMALVPPETAALMARPPLAGSWMDLTHMQRLIHAVDKIGGLAAVRDFARRAVADARKPYMGVVEGVLKLFGTSPATLLKRMNALVRSFRFVPSSERAGVMEIEWATEHKIAMCEFVAQVPSLQTLLDACGVKGVVGPPERLAANRARFHIQW